MGVDSRLFLVLLPWLSCWWTRRPLPCWEGRRTDAAPGCPPSLCSTPFGTACWGLCGWGLWLVAGCGMGLALGPQLVDAASRPFVGRRQRTCAPWWNSWWSLWWVCGKRTCGYKSRVKNEHPDAITGGLDYSFVPFIIKLQSVFAIQWCHKLSDHSLGLLPLIPPQHPHMGHQPGHCTYCHAAYFPLDVISNPLYSARGQEKREGCGRKDVGDCQRKEDSDKNLDRMIRKSSIAKGKKWDISYYLRYCDITAVASSLLIVVIFHRKPGARLRNESN